MTLPVNRFNSLRDARAFLLALVGDRAMPEHVRQRASSVLKHFPGEHELHRLAELAPEVLSAKLVS